VVTKNRSCGKKPRGREWIIEFPKKQAGREGIDRSGRCSKTIFAGGHRENVNRKGPRRKSASRHSEGAKKKERWILQKARRRSSEGQRGGRGTDGGERGKTGVGPNAQGFALKDLEGELNLDSLQKRETQGLHYR